MQGLVHHKQGWCRPKWSNLQDPALRKLQLYLSWYIYIYIYMLKCKHSILRAGSCTLLPLGMHWLCSQILDIFIYVCVCVCVCGAEDVIIVSNVPLDDLLHSVFSLFIDI